MAGLKRQLQHHSHTDEHAKCVFQEAEPALKRLRITEGDVQGHAGLQPDQQQQQQQDMTQQQQQHLQLQQQQQQHPDFLLELPACEQHDEQLGYPFNLVLRELHMERLQRLQGTMQQAPCTPS